MPPSSAVEASCATIVNVQKPKAFQPAAERDKVTDLIEAEDSGDLDELEDDFKDDVFLEQYR